MPTKLKNWKQSQWKFHIFLLPPELTLAQAAKQLRKGYGNTSIQLKRYGYRIKDTRGGFKGKRKLTLATIKRINWKRENSKLARRHRVSREWIRRIRQAQGKPKVNGRKA